MQKIKDILAVLLYKIGLSADFLTYLGLFFALVSACFVYNGDFIWAGGALLVSGFFDLMDGSVARLSGKASAFGGILDSCLDRYGDGFVLGALVIVCAEEGMTLYAVLALSALLGSFSISYVRARAECEMDACRTGFWERGERVVYLALALLLNNVTLALWVLGLGTHTTALRRLALARRNVVSSRAYVGAQPSNAENPRSNLFYWIKIALLCLTLAFLRPNF